jgi:hypothetical protein
MRASVAVDHATAFVGRLAMAFTELTLAAAVIVGAIVAGHNLTEWRDWYATVYHPWLDIQRTVPEVSEP